MRYQRTTLQLLPSTERPTYPGLKVDVLEMPAGELVIEHEGEIIPSQEAPPRPNILHDVNGNSSHRPPYRNGLERRWERVLATLDRERAEHNDREGGAKGLRRTTPVPRSPTPKQIARWKTIHAAKRRGLSIRAIARDWGPQEHREEVPRG